MTGTERRRSPVVGALSGLGSVLAWMALLAVLVLLVAAVAVPRLAGATPYTVLSDSMTPRFPAGTLLITRPTPTGQAALGQVITYQLESGRPEVVSHRIIAITTNARGGVRFRTQGDANPTPDAELVRPEQVRGTLWYAIPYVGYLTGWLAGSARMVLIAIAALGLIGYAVTMFVLAARDHRRRADRGSTTGERSSEHVEATR